MQTRAIATSPPLRLMLAIATLVHGALLLMGSFQRTYDAYVHMFCANNYAQDWFGTWDTRWYTGFTVTSYPPGSQTHDAPVNDNIRCGLWNWGA